MRGAVPLYNQLEVCVGIDNKEKLRLYDIIEPMPNRWSFAVNDPEQIYDWQKVGLRRTSGVLLNFPNSLIAQKIAWPDKTIFPADGNIMSGSIFYSQLFKNATHTLSKHVFGNVVRSMSTGYSRVDRYRRVSCIGDEMLSLALTLRDQDAELTKHAEAIRKQSDTPLGKLSKNLNDANR
ncbi:MAG: hypothetical protein MRY32_05120, partial [Rickettsiales bacterium]|nr:hypothetical protein [Rickettsiales bacterium]